MSAGRMNPDEMRALGTGQHRIRCPECGRNDRDRTLGVTVRLTTSCGIAIDAGLRPRSAISGMAYSASQRRSADAEHREACDPRNVRGARSGAISGAFEARLPNLTCCLADALWQRTMFGMASCGIRPDISDRA